MPIPSCRGMYTRLLTNSGSSVKSGHLEIKTRAINRSPFVVYSIRPITYPYCYLSISHCYPILSYCIVLPTFQAHVYTLLYYPTILYTSVLLPYLTPTPFLWPVYTVSSTPQTRHLTNQLGYSPLSQECPEYTFFEVKMKIRIRTCVGGSAE